MSQPLPSVMAQKALPVFQQLTEPRPEGAVVSIQRDGLGLKS